MRAIITAGKGDLNVVDIAMPVTGDYDCLVKIHSCLFCNSTDLHIVENSFNFGIPYPVVLGHESIGFVVETGSKVKYFAAGDLVTRPHAIYPHEVSSGIGSAWGGFAEYGKIKDYQAMADDGLAAGAISNCYKSMQKLPKVLTPDQCMMICCLKEIYSSTSQITPVKNRSFLIAGAGAAGCLFALFLKMAGAAQVTLTARRQIQLDFAQRNCTADKVVLLDDIASSTNAFDALVDTTGSVTTVLRLLDTVIKPNGAFYSYAVYPEMCNAAVWDAFKQKSNLQRIDPKEASVHDEVCQMLIDGRLNTASYITHRFTLDEFEPAWSTIINKTSCKTAIVF
jgi:threonine dehydrogenase-like Zn-dependent dehydrogenase